MRVAALNGPGCHAYAVDGHLTLYTVNEKLRSPKIEKIMNEASPPIF